MEVFHLKLENDDIPTLEIVENFGGIRDELPWYIGTEARIVVTALGIVVKCQIFKALWRTKDKAINRLLAAEQVSFTLSVS